MAFHNNPRIATDGLDLCLDAALGKCTNALSDAGHPTKAGLTYGGAGVEEDYQPSSGTLITRADKTISHGNDLRAYDINTQANWAGPATGAGAYFAMASGGNNSGFYGYLNTGYGFTSNPVVGKRYRLLMRAKSTSSIHLRFYDGAGGYDYFSADVGTTLKTYTYDFTCQHATGCFVYGASSFSAGETLYVDRYEVYEIGAWADASGNNNDGTLYNAPALTTTAPKYFDFDGTDDYITVGDLGTKPDWTVSCWWMSDTTNENTMFHLNSTRPQGFTVWSTANMAYYVVKGGSSTHTGTSYSWSTGKWYHLTLNHTSGTNVMLTYINGVQVDSDTLDVDAQHQSFNEVVIGDGSYGDWDGKIAAFHIYDRVLTAAEVKTNFNTHRARFGV